VNAQLIVALFPLLHYHHTEISPRLLELFLKVNNLVYVGMRATFLLLTRFCRAVLLLCSILLFTPGRSSAECGDYLIILKPGPGAQEAHDHTAQVSPPYSVPLNRPCRGLNCSGTPTRDFPPDAPLISPTLQIKEFTQPLATIADELNRFSTSAIVITSPRPIHRSSLIFHPPRLTQVG
jgi:hypothetical protein